MPRQLEARYKYFDGFLPVFSPRHSTCPSEDSPFQKLRLHSDESVCSSNNKASPLRHSDADTILLTPVAVQPAVPGIVEKTYSSSCPTGDLVLDSKPNLFSRVREKAAAVADSTDNLSNGNEVESHGASEDHSGEESVSESESEVYGEGERVEAVATGANSRVDTEHKHGNGSLSDSDGKCAEANETCLHPDDASSPHACAPFPPGCSHPWPRPPPSPDTLNSLSEPLSSPD